MKEMKALLVLAGVLSSIGIASSAMAADPVETVVIGVDFEISKCTVGTPPSNGSVTSETCDATASLPTNVSIALSNCSTSQDNNMTSTECYGTWTGTQSRDGHSFDASVSISKTISVIAGQSTVSYYLDATIGSASIGMNLSKGSVTDSVSFNGSRLLVPNSNDSYSPSLLIAHAMPTPPNN